MRSVNILHFKEMGNGDWGLVLTFLLVTHLIISLVKIEILK